MNIRPIIIAVATIVAAFTLTACIDGTTAQPSAAAKTATAQAQNQENLLASTPIPILTTSQERENLVKRAKRINVQNMSSCITLFSQSGAVVGFFPVAGKVSSLNSYLLPGDELVWRENTYGSWGATREAPDIDGAYGSNSDGIFFFTADSDAYVEWKGDYFWSDACLAPATPTILVQQVAEE